MLHFRCIDEVGFVKGHFRFLLYARYLLFYYYYNFFYTNTKKNKWFKQVRGPAVYRLEFCCHLLIF